MRLIDADAYKILYGKECPKDCGVCDFDQKDCMCGLIDKAPTVDAAPVVRCKDCEYGDYDSKPDGAMVCLRTKDGFWRKETDFCSYGKRKDNNEH